MVIEDEDGRALKFRTRTRAEYARVRPGMVAEAVLVSRGIAAFAGNEAFAAFSDSGVCTQHIQR